MIEIDHGGGLTTRYAHLSKILVNEGDRVTLGERIGKAVRPAVPPARICTTRSAATGMPWIRCGFSRPQKAQAAAGIAVAARSSSCVKNRRGRFRGPVVVQIMP
jgi:hypothetical protein